MSDVWFQAEFYSSITAAPGLNKPGPVAGCHDHNTLPSVTSFSGYQSHVALVFYLLLVKSHRYKPS